MFSVFFVDWKTSATLFFTGYIIMVVYHYLITARYPSIYLHSI